MESLFKLGMIVQVIDQLTGPARAMARAVGNLQNLASRGEAMTRWGQSVAISGALAQGAATQVKNALGGLLEPVMALDEAMKPLETVTTSTMGSIQASMEATRRAAIEWQRAHGTAAEEFVRTAYQMASAGLNDIQAIAGTRAAMALATASMGDNVEAANLLAVVYNNMGNKAADVETEMTRIADVLGKTQALFQIANLNQLTEGMKYAIPAALQFGESLESLSTIIGQLNNAGLQGSQAGTAYAASMRQMVRASRMLGFELARTSTGGIDFLGTLENIRERFGTFEAMPDQVKLAFQQAFGEEGVRAIALLLPQLDTARRNLEAVRNASGTVAEAQRTIESSVPARWRRVQGVMRSVQTQIGTQLLPTVEWVIPRVLAAVSAFGRFAEAHPTLTRTVVVLAAVSLGGLALAATLLTVVGGFATMAGHGLRAVASVGRAWVWLMGVMRSERALAMTRMLGDGMGRGLGAVRAALLRLGPAALQGTRSLLLFGRQALLTGIRALPPLIASTWAWTAALLANPVTWIVVGIMALVAAIVLLVRHWNAVREAGAAAWQAVVGAAQSALSWLTTAPVSALQRLVDFLGSLWETFRQAGVGLWNAFVQGIQSVIDAPVNLVRTGLEKLRNLLPFSDAREGPLSQLTRSGQALVTTFAAGIERAVPQLQPALAGALAGGLPPPAVPDLSGLVRLIPAPSASRADSQRQPLIRIEGGLHLHVDRVDDEEDLVQVLRRWYLEVGGE